MHTIKWSTRIVIAVFVTGCWVPAQAQGLPSGQAAKPNAAKTVTTRVVSNGNFISATSWPNDLSQHAVTIIEESTPQGSQLQLIYNGTDNDPDSKVCSVGPETGDEMCFYTRTTTYTAFGPINPADVVIKNHTARLTTDLLANPNIIVIRCVAEPVTTCDIYQPPSGVIDIGWKVTQQFSEFTAGMYVIRTGPNLTRVSGSHDSRSAAATGTLLGLPFLATHATMGTSNNRSLEITHAVP